MFWSALAHLLALLLDLSTARRQPASAKDLEIAVLRHQLRVALRRQPRPRLTRWEQLTLALLVAKLRHLPVSPASTGPGASSWSRPRRCCAGTAPWCAGNGPSDDTTQAGGAPTPRLRP